VRSPLLVGIGAGLIELRSTPGLRSAGIVAMTVGLIAALGAALHRTGDPT
jgi:hypothetical protein